MASSDHNAKSFRPGLGLGAKFSIWMFFFILTMMFLSYLFFSRHQRQSLAEEISLRGRTICASLAAAAEEPLVMKDDLILAKLVADVKNQNPGVIACRILDDRGRIWAHSDISQLSAADSLGADRKSLLPADGRAFIISHPITVKGKAIGQAQVAISRQSIERALARAGRGLALISLGIMAIGLLGMLIMVSLVVGSLGRITLDIEAIGHGDLDRRIVTRRRDEVGLIAQAVRLMASNLKEAQAQLVEQERLKREMQIAREIQQSLLPTSLPQSSGLSLAVRYRAASEVGGDYYDLIPLDGDRLGIIVADVSGKGVGGSMVMAMLRSMVHLEAPSEPSPRRLLGRLHRALCGDIPDGMFVTMFYEVLDPKNKKIICCRAGHNPAYLLKADDNHIMAVAPRGRPLGISLEADEGFVENLEEQSLAFAAGDRIIAYSDGIVEAENPAGENFGEERFCQILSRYSRLEPEALADRILFQLDEFTSGRPQSDDITLVIAQNILS